MEYNPRYPQPFTFSQAIALDPAVAWDEIARLKNSLLHLRRSQEQLREYLQGLVPGEVDLEVGQAVKENEITIASQDERIFMLKLALTHHGHSFASQQTSESHLPPPPPASTTERPRSFTRSSSNGLDDIPHHVSVDSEVRETQGPEDGVYL